MRWAPSSYLALDTPLLLQLWYIWCPDNPNGLLGLWHDKYFFKGLLISLKLVTRNLKINWLRIKGKRIKKRKRRIKNWLKELIHFGVKNVLFMVCLNIPWIQHLKNTKHRFDEYSQENKKHELFFYQGWKNSQLRRRTLIIEDGDSSLPIWWSLACDEFEWKGKKRRKKEFSR